MKVSEQKLRKVIRGVLSEGARWNLQKRMQDTLQRDYDEVDSRVTYPYGRNRGDEQSVTKYVRKDGEKVPDQDILVFKDLEAEQKKDSWAALSGVYTHEVVDDGTTLIVKYYRHTAG